MPKNTKPKLIAFLILILFIAGTVRYVQYLMDKPLNIEIPKHFTYNGTKIALAWTDDNTGENLIIQSDKKEYNGFSSVDVYFSITNINRKDQNMDVVVWVEDEKVRVEGMERIGINGNNKKLKIENEMTIEGETPASRLQLSSRFQFDRSVRKDINGFTTGYSVNDNIESGQTNYYKATLKYPPMSKGEFFIEAFGKDTKCPIGHLVSCGTTYGHLDPWYSSDWGYRRPITINASQVATTTSAFPVLATTTLADLKTTTHDGKVASSTGADIVFADSAGDILNYEREYYASTTGEIAYWIKTDISSTTDTILYMYYGNSTMPADLATTTGVWDDNYVMVNHLAHDGVATTTYPDFLDSTKYDNDGSSKNMNSDDLVDGQIDGSLDFDGGDDYITLGDNDMMNDWDELTVSMWINPDAFDTHLFHKYYVIEIQHVFSGFRAGIYGITTVDSNVHTATNIPYYLVLKYDGAEVLIYVNGADDTSSNPSGSGTIATSNYDLAIGALSSSHGDAFNGLIDEVRISNVARTAGWIETEYNNQVSVGDFMAFGAEEDETPTEFVSKIRAAGDNGDYLNLSSWEDDVECDLTATTTRVYSGSITGTIATSSTVELFRDETYLNITANVLATSTGGQILLDNITGANYDLVAQSGDQWRLASSTDNMWTITGTTGNELGDTVIAVAECYNDWPSGLDDYVTIDGWTTDSTNYVKVYAPEGERHDGIFGSGFTLTNTTTNYKSLIIISESYTVCDGLTLHQNRSNTYDGIYFAGSASSKGAVVKNCIFYAEKGGHQAIQSSTGVNPLPVMINNIIYGNWNDGIHIYSGILYNNTIVGVNGRGVCLTYDYFHPIAKNNIVINNSGGDYRYPSSFDASSSNNLSSDDTAPGSNALTNISLAQMAFINTTSGSEDFHIYADSIARNRGVDVSGIFTTDIDGQTRPLGLAWEIGADEIVDHITQINSPYTDSGNWYNANWKYKRAIVLEADQISTTTDAFPVLATTTLSDLKSYAYDGNVASNDGHDIIFVDGDNTTLLNFEREYYDPATGEIAYWIKTDISSTTDKTIYMYYGSSASSDQATTTGVWDDNFVMVNHLAHDGVATTTYPDFNDSTKYGNDGSSKNMNSDDLVDGQVDGALDFDGGDDYVDVGNVGAGTYSAVSISAWVEGPAYNAEYYYIYLELKDSGNFLNFLRNTWDRKIMLQRKTVYGSYANVYTSDVDDGFMHLITYTSSNATDHKIYTDGVLSDTSNVSAAPFALVGGTIGINSANTFDGIIDEVRISNVARTSGWIETEYNNQVSVGSFMTIGGEESLNRVVIVNAPITNYLTDGLVGHWTFNGQDMDWASTTAEALDRSGNSNNGNVIGAKAVIGKVGQGMEFDGGDDYIDAGNVYDGVKTVVFWIKADDITSRKIIDIDATDQIEIDASSDILATDFPTATVYVDGAVASTITNDWHLVVITDTTGVNASAMDIGRVSAGYFDGLIDEVRVYNRALSADEIGELYRVGSRKMRVN